MGSPLQGVESETSTSASASPKSGDGAGTWATTPATPASPMYLRQSPALVLDLIDEGDAELDARVLMQKGQIEHGEEQLSPSLESPIRPPPGLEPPPAVLQALKSAVMSKGWSFTIVASADLAHGFTSHRAVRMAPHASTAIFAPKGSWCLDAKQSVPRAVLRPPIGRLKRTLAKRCLWLLRLSKRKVRLVLLQLRRKTRPPRAPHFMALASASRALGFTSQVDVRTALNALIAIYALKVNSKSVERQRRT